MRAGLRPSSNADNYLPPFEDAASQNGDTSHVKITRGTKLGVAFRQWSEIHGIDSESFRYMLDGERWAAAAGTGRNRPGGARCHAARGLARAGV